MFLRFSNKEVLNLDNFDGIKLLIPDQAKDDYKVVAIRYQPHLKFTGFIAKSDAWFSSYKNTIYTIKTFSEKQEAISFYERLEYHWINKISDIFDVT